MNNTNEKLTIALTGRQPVTINEENWPIIASATSQWANGGKEETRYCQLNVRRHSDGRTIVYGNYVSLWDGEQNRSVGFLVDGQEDLVNEINQVGIMLEAPEHTIQDCLSSLPAEELE